MHGLAEFLTTLSEEQLSVFQYLDQQLLAAGLGRKIRFRVSFYDYHKWLCYLNPLKNGNFELCFLQGVLLHKTNPVLDVKKRKMVAGYEIMVQADIDIDLILEIVNNAMALQSAENISL